MSTPGPITKLQRSFAYRVSKLFPSEFLRWIDLVSAAIDNITGGGAQTQERYVNKGGSDTAGNGSFEKPYLTIQKAITSIPDASAVKPYIIRVSAGVYITPFVLEKGIYIRGAGSGSAEYFGTPESGATQILPAPANVIGASFSGNVLGDCGIFDCSLLGPLLADFLSAGSTGAATIILENLLTLNPISVVGGLGDNAENVATIRNITIAGGPGADVTLFDLGSSYVSGLISPFGTNLKYTQTAAFQSFHTAAGLQLPGINSILVTWTSALLANALFLEIDGFLECDANINGAGAIVESRSLSRSVALADGNADIGFGTTAAPSFLGVNCGSNFFEMTPTTQRTLTLELPIGLAETRFKVRNLATVAGRDINLSFPAGSVAPNSPTYCPASGEVDIIWNPTLSRWSVSPQVQRAKSTLVAGRNPGSPTVIPFDITANSCVVTTLEVTNGGVTGVNCSCQSRTVGARAGGGGITLESIDINDNTVVTDISTYNILVN